MKLFYLFFSRFSKLKRDDQTPAVGVERNIFRYFEFKRAFVEKKKKMARPLCRYSTRPRSKNKGVVENRAYRGLMPPAIRVDLYFVTANRTQIRRYLITISRGYVLAHVEII